MNSVMDDNRLLTLPNGERIRLQSHCRLLFDVILQNNSHTDKPATCPAWNQCLNSTSLGTFPVFCLHVLLELLAPYKHCLCHIPLAALLLLIATPVQVGDLQYASPATVSRCGMVFVDSRNLGYMPFVNTWLASRYATIPRHHSTSVGHDVFHTSRQYNRLFTAHKCCYAEHLRHRVTCHGLCEITASGKVNCLRRTAGATLQRQAC